MKKIIIPAFVLALALLLAACGGSPAPAADATTNDAEMYASPGLNLNYENALPARLQLTLGSLKLAETDTPITAEQARVMLPLWEGLLNMTRSGNSAQAEVNALLAQIEATFTPEQIAAIHNMKLTSTDMQTWAKANGVTLGSGSGQPGQGSGMSPEARATKQAAEGKTGGSSGSGASTAILNALIVYLQGLAQ